MSVPLMSLTTKTITASASPFAVLPTCAINVVLLEGEDVSLATVTFSVISEMTTSSSVITFPAGSVPGAIIAGTSIAIIAEDVSAPATGACTIDQFGTITMGLVVAGAFPGPYTTGGTFSGFPTFVIQYQVG